MGPLKVVDSSNNTIKKYHVIQEYQYYTMSISQYHGCCQYDESMCIPPVLANNMCQC